MDSWWIQACALSIPSWSDFNSSGVQQDCLGPYNFQSHLGLISTHLAVCDVTPAAVPFNPILVWFQQLWLWTWIQQDCSFNPILVWFQLVVFVVDFCTWSSFNPILVWFQRCEILDEPYYAANFQSHLGLISTFVVFFNLVLKKVAFNPILVWFQRKELHTNAASRITFNPILVWFQRRLLPARNLSWDSSFNPILVWFQRLLEVFLGLCTVIFQSHLGLISTIFIRYLRRIFNELSIPSWSDFNYS